METNLIINSIIDIGYVIVRNFFNKDDMLKLNNVIDTDLKSNICVPYSNVPHGYGNLLHHEKFLFLQNDTRIKILCEKFFRTKNFCYNHLLIHNKPPWIGIGHEWHQESANIDSFAPGKNWVNNWQDFLQIFVPIDSHNLNNGCLKLIPKSHTLGLLDHEDIVTAQMSHKRRIKSNLLVKASEKFGVVNCEVEPGDVIFFNHLVAHGSSNNNSNKRRRVVVMQARIDDFKKDSERLNNELKYRVGFTIKSLKEKIEYYEHVRESYYSEVTKYTLTRGKNE